MDLSSLIYEAKEDSILAQRYLYDQFANMMFLVCRRYVKRDEEAEEVMMDGFLKIFQSLKNFEYISDKATVAWMKKIMINKCLRHLGPVSSNLEVVSGESPDIMIDEEIISRLTVKEIYTYVTRLPEGYRMIFNLFELEQMPHGEIVKLLGIKLKTCHTRLYKARHMLMQTIIKNNKEYEARVKK